MGKESKDVVKRPSRKQLAVMLREKQAELLAAKKSRVVKLTECRDVEHKTLLTFKLGKTGEVKEADTCRRNALARARMRCNTLRATAETELENAVTAARKRATEALSDADSEYLEIKRKENAKFGVFSVKRAEKYQPALDELTTRLDSEYAALEAKCDEEVSGLQKEISEIETELERRRGPKPQEASGASPETDRPSP